MDFVCIAVAPPEAMIGRARFGTPGRVWKRRRSSVTRTQYTSCHWPSLEG